MPDFSEALIAPVAAWFFYLFSPVACVREALTKSLQNDIPKLMAQFWSVPVLVILLCNSLVLYRFGIDIVHEPVVFMAALLIAVGRLVIEAIILVGVLWVMRAAVQSGIVLACYTVQVIYAPIYIGLAIPNSVYANELAQFYRSKNLNLADILPYFLHHSQEVRLSVDVPTVYPLIADTFSAVNLFAAVLVAECISQAARMPRQKVYIAVAVANALSFLPTIAAALLQIILSFVYQPAGSGLPI